MTNVDYVIASYRTSQLASNAAVSIAGFLREGERIVVSEDHAGTGYSATLNRGISGLGRAGIVCCLNADVEMLESDGAVRDLFAKDDGLAIVGPRQVDQERRIVHGGIVPHEDGGTEWDLDLRHRCWRFFLDENPAADVLTAKTFEVPAVSGAVFYVRRWILDALGGWPEWTRFYYEDTFLCYLARHYGWRVVYTGATTWRHLHEQGSPLGREERVDRLRYARERFCFECGRVGIPLRIPEGIEP